MVNSKINSPHVKLCEDAGIRCGFGTMCDVSFSVEAEVRGYHKHKDIWVAGGRHAVFQ